MRLISCRIEHKMLSRDSPVRVQHGCHRCSYRTIGKRRVGGAPARVQINIVDIPGIVRSGKSAVIPEPKLERRVKILIAAHGYEKLIKFILIEDGVIIDGKNVDPVTLIVHKVKVKMISLVWYL